MPKKVKIQEVGYDIIVTGEVDQKAADAIIYESGRRYGTVDVRQATFVTDKVMKYFLELIKTDKLILPANIAWRHMNAAIRNGGLCEIEVPEDCELFAMKDGNVYNRRLTKLVFRKIHP